MKILFLGYYKEFGGWSEASMGLIKALEATGYDIVCRNVQLTTDVQERKEIEHLEKKKLNNVDICIQHLLPHHLVGSNQFKKNIAYFVTESENISSLPWIRSLKLMGEVWTPCDSCVKEIELNGINVHKIHHAFDMSVYSKKYKDLGIGQEQAFKFYTIASASDRKNIENLIKIYFHTFEDRDNVNLIIKTVSAETAVELEKKISQLKNSLRIHKNKNKYPKIFLIANTLTQDEIYSLHSSCDCFINISHGEAWSIPSFEAMCFNNTPICTRWGGPSEYIDESNPKTGTLIDYTLSVCEYKNAPFSFLGTGKELWASPNEIQVIEAMKFYRNNSFKNNQDGLIAGEKFSIINVAEKIKERLDNE